MSVLLGGGGLFWDLPTLLVAIGLVLPAFANDDLFMETFLSSFLLLAVETGLYTELVDFGLLGSFFNMLPVVGLDSFLLTVLLPTGFGLIPLAAGLGSFFYGLLAPDLFGDSFLYVLPTGL